MDEREGLSPASEPASSSAVPPAPQYLRGFMKKQGPGFSSKWQMRWFEQKGNRLYYYKPSSLSFSLSESAPDADSAPLSPPSERSEKVPSPTSDRPGSFPNPPRSSSPRSRISSTRSSKSETKGRMVQSERITRDETEGASNRLEMESDSALGDADEDQPPMPNPRGFIDIKKVSAIVGRANDINSAKNQEKDHYQFDLYTAERIFRLAAPTEEQYLYWHEGIKCWKRYMSSLLPPLVPSLEGLTTSLPPSLAVTFADQSNASDSLPSSSSSTMPISAVLSPNSPLLSTDESTSSGSLWSPSSSPSSSLNYSALSQRLAKYSSLPNSPHMSARFTDSRDEGDGSAKKSTKITYSREDRFSTHRRSGTPTLLPSIIPKAEDSKLARRRPSPRDNLTRAISSPYIRAQSTAISPPASPSSSFGQLPGFSRATWLSDDKEALYQEREKNLEEMIALKDKELALLKEELQAEKSKRNARPVDQVGATPEVRLIEELAKERSEALQSRIEAKKQELELRKELLQKESAIKHLLFAIDELEKQQQAQQASAESAVEDNGKNDDQSGELTPTIEATGSGEVPTANTEESTAIAEEEDKPSRTISQEDLSDTSPRVSIDNSSPTIKTVPGVVVSFDDWRQARGEPVPKPTEGTKAKEQDKDWGRESRRAEKKREKEEERERKEEKKKELRTSDSLQTSSSKPLRRKEQKQKDDETRKMREAFDQERREQRLALNFVRSQCELLEAQKQAAEDTFGQMCQSLEKELSEIRQRFSKLENLAPPSPERSKAESGELLLTYFCLLYNIISDSGATYVRFTKGAESRPEVQRLYEECRAIPFERWPAWIHQRRQEADPSSFSQRPSAGAGAD